MRPMLEYACPVWHSSASTVNALALERVQANVARTILAAFFLAFTDGEGVPRNV